MLALMIAGEIVGYTLVEGVVNEALPDHWNDKWRDKDYPHRAFMAVLWPLLAFWAPIGILRFVFGLPRRVLTARRERKQLPQARVLP